MAFSTCSRGVKVSRLLLEESQKESSELTDTSVVWAHTWASMIYRQLGCAQNRKNRPGGEFPCCSHEYVQQGKWRGGDTAVAGVLLLPGHWAEMLCIMKTV